MNVGNTGERQDRKFDKRSLACAPDTIRDAVKTVHPAMNAVGSTVHGHKEVRG